MMQCFTHVLREVAIVSHLCISFPYVLQGLCEDYLTCNIAFSAVMPLSRASTRGRYSRIEGVTLQLRLNSPNPSLYILASCMLYFPLLIYSLHAFLICIVFVKLVPKFHFNLKKLKTGTFGT